jgi:shikimate kinase
MAGSGKTTIGKALAKKLGWLFLDTDERVEKIAKKSIGDIFDELGSGYFLEKESEALKESIKETNIVIATGGRTYLNYLNKALMTDSGMVIYLKSDIDTIHSRLNKPGEVEKRRFLNGITSDTLRYSIEMLLKLRHGEYSDGSIEVDSNKDKAEVVNDIIKLFEDKMKKEKPLTIKDIYFEIEYKGKVAKLPIADTPRNRKMYGIAPKKTRKKANKTNRRKS